MQIFSEARSPLATTTARPPTCADYPEKKWRSSSRLDYSGIHGETGGGESLTISSLSTRSMDTFKFPEATTKIQHCLLFCSTSSDAVETMLWLFLLLDLVIW